MLVIHLAGIRRREQMLRAALHEGRTEATGVRREHPKRRNGVLYRSSDLNLAVLLFEYLR